MKIYFCHYAVFLSIFLIGCTKSVPTAPCELVPKDYNAQIYEMPRSDLAVFFEENYKRCKIRSLKKNDNALLSVGISVLYGLGTQSNPMKASLWFKGAADKGNRQAQLILAQMFEDGVGVPRAPVIAQKYLNAAQK